MIKKFIVGLMILMLLVFNIQSLYAQNNKDSNDIICPKFGKFNDKMPGPPDDLEKGFPKGPFSRPKHEMFKEKVEFIKNLTPKQREEAKKFMMLGKAYNDLANTYVEMGKYDEAIATLKKILDMKLPEFIPQEHVKMKQKMVSMRIIQIYLKAGKDKEALEFANKLIASENLSLEEQSRLYLMIGNIYKKSKNNEKALEMFQKSVDVLEKSK